MTDPAAAPTNIPTYNVTPADQPTAAYPMQGMQNPTPAPPPVDVEMETALAHLSSRYRLGYHRTQAIRSILLNQLQAAGWFVGQASTAAPGGMN